MRNKKYCLSALSVFLLVFCVAAYSFAADGKKNVKDDSKAADAALLSEEEALKPIVIEPYIYDAAGRRDPFISPLAATKIKKGEMKTGRPKVLHPLEKFKLTQMKIIGIVRYENEYYASVELPDGKSYTIKKGLVMGDGDGKIVEITADTVRVEELTLDARGNVVKIPSELKLKREEEE
jgi:type IV pilus assembly protein PilP